MGKALLGSSSIAWLTFKPSWVRASRLRGLLEAGGSLFHVSDAVLVEVREVLERPRVRAKNSVITNETTWELFDRLSR